MDMYQAVALARLGVNDGESCRLKAYPDPLTHGAPWTIGWGCTGPDIGPTTVWTQAKADQERDERLWALVPALDRPLPWWRGMCPEREAVFLELAYNTGLHGLLEFHDMLAAAKAWRWAEARDELLDSKWARQVHEHRANRLADQLLTGVCPLVQISEP